MLEIIVAFVISGSISLIVGHIANLEVGAGTFPAIFAAAFTVMDKRRARLEQTHGRQHEAELKMQLEQLKVQIGELEKPQTLTAQQHEEPDAPEIPELAITQEEEHAVPPEPEIPELEITQEKVKEIKSELDTVQVTLKQPLVDWRRTLVGTIAASALIGVSILVVTRMGYMPILLPRLWQGAMIGFGFWLGRTSRSSGFLGSVIMGASTGIAAVLILLLTGELGSTSLEGIATIMVIYAVMLTMAASIGGFFGYKMRKKDFWLNSLFTRLTCFLKRS